MLSQAELREFWGLFKSKPFFAQWDDAELRVSPQIDRLDLRADQAVFRSGSRAECLYMVGQGTIVQRVFDGDTLWLRRELKRGDYFGHQALFTDEYDTEAVAATNAVLYTVPAETLRLALEHVPDLYEELSHEKRGERLRGIPLFRCLSEEDLLRLGGLMEDMTIDAGANLPLGEKPGLWIIDYGQTRVTGPAGLGRADWRLTAGNFFLTEGVRLGSACIANSATAVLTSHVFHLPLEHIDRLSQAFPDIAQLVAKPLDIADALAPIALFDGPGMTDAHRQNLAQYVGWSFVPERQNVTSQGSVGHSYVILRDGAAVVSSLDEQGRLRPRNYLSRGQNYGSTSLLQGKMRDVTVRAVAAPAQDLAIHMRGADVLTLDRRDLAVAFAERRDLWRRGISLFDHYEQTKEEKWPYAWQTEGETIIWQGRSHPWWLIWPLFVLALIALAAWSLVQITPPELQDNAYLIWVVVLGVLGIIGVLSIVNYYDDYYIITNRRVARRDRQFWLFAETMMEVPLETVQDVTLDAGFWGRLFGFGTVTIRTAAKVGAIQFANVPAPESIRQSALQERAQVLALTRGYQREALRNTLITTLKVALPVADRLPALGKGVHPPGWLELRTGWRRAAHTASTLPSKQNAWTRFWLRVTGPLPESWRKVLFGTPGTAAENVEGTVWRKHPIVLIWRAWLPFLIVLGLLICFPLLSDVGRSLSVGGAAFTLPWLVALVAMVVWLWWEWEDYRNDIYVVTDEKIIDIERKPLGLDYKRREGNLERVQSVDSRQAGFVAYLLNYGTVVIRTAAADEGYDFVNVPNPKHVQSVVFQKLDALRQRKAAKDAADRQQSVVETLQVYDELRQSESQLKMKQW